MEAIESNSCVESYQHNMCARCGFVRTILILLLSTVLLHAEKIGCKDEKGKDVDWFINYKLPKIKDASNEDIQDGVAYAYILAPGSKEWTLSTKNVLAKSDSMMEKTLALYYANKRDLTYLFYNDDAPHKRSKGTGAHAKGVLAFDDKTGFWLIHSIPNFPDHNKYDYPESAENNGQTALCVTFKTSALNEIAAQLLFDNPNIYAKKLTNEIKKKLDENAQSLFSKKPNVIREEPFTREVELKSLGGVTFISFAKDNQLQEDLYSEIIAPYLKTSLVVETWRKGAGGVMKKECKTDYPVVDIQEIKMTLGKGKDKTSVSFQYTQDHSKWAISDDDDQNYVCIADLNRMVSQEKRGGGALCFKSSSVVEAFDSIIEGSDTCDKDKK